MDPGRIFRLLAEHAVRSVLVGGLAAAAQGASRLTYDVDRIRLGEVEVRVLSVEQLILAKQAMDSPKDRDHLDQLLALRRLREEEGR